SHSARDAQPIKHSRFDLKFPTESAAIAKGASNRRQWYRLMVRRTIISFVGLIAIATAALDIAAADPNTVVATSGSHRLTEGMLEDATYFSQFLAGQRFSAPDLAVMREGLISTFRTQGAKDATGYQALAQFVPALRRTRSVLAAAKAREAAWGAFAK